MNQEEVDRLIKSIEKLMRAMDRKANKYTKSGNAMWAAVHTGRVLGLLDARNLVLEAVKEKNER